MESVSKYLTFLRYVTIRNGHRHPLLATVVASVVIALFFFCIHSAAAEQPVGVYEGKKAFRGYVRRDMAQRAARLSAELEAYEQSARVLAREPDLRFVSESGGKSGPSLDGLTRMLFVPKLTATGTEGFPPNLLAVVRLRVEAPSPIRPALLEAIKRPDVIEIQDQVHKRLRELAAGYDALAQIILPRRPTEEGGMEEVHALRSIVNEMVAMDRFVALLPLYERRWTDPDKAREGLLLAESLAPNNPLVLTGLAEISLQFDRPLASLEYAGRSLAVAPDFARTHDVQGAALLRQRLPALAAEAFGRAVALSPENSVYYVHRASAYLVLEEEAGMCRDFQRACALGDCEGLQWARGEGRCEEALP